jgi:hypothetical protein
LFSKAFLEKALKIRRSVLFKLLLWSGFAQEA